MYAYQSVPLASSSFRVRYALLDTRFTLYSSRKNHDSRDFSWNRSYTYVTVADTAKEKTTENRIVRISNAKANALLNWRNNWSIERRDLYGPGWFILKIKMLLLLSFF